MIFFRLAILQSVLTAVVIATSCFNLTALSGLSEAESWFVSNSTEVTTDDLQYCDMQVVAGNRINIWLRLPDQDSWNGRFTQYGCGGSCGYNSFTSGTSLYDFTEAIKKGYAISTTDMGVTANSGGDWTPFHSNFQMRVDWGHHATHITAVISKDLIATHYNSTPKYSYHLGSSTGGRQSTMLAQRYPQDFNGIFAVNPALNETGITAFSISWSIRAAILDIADYTQAITAADAMLLHKLVLDECDALDGLADGIIGLPRSCHPNIDKLLCTAGQTTDCLSDVALQATKAIYSGPVNNLTSAKLNLEGFLPGSEEEWIDVYIPAESGTALSMLDFTTSYLSSYAFWPDPLEPITAFNFNYNSPTLLRDTSIAEGLEYGGFADMQKFQQLGGKIIIAQGLNDVAVAPSFARDLFERAGNAMGKAARDSCIRYFEMPGCNHGSRGAGAGRFDHLDIISAWVETGTAPSVIEASKLDTNGTVLFKRPLYAYPYTAKYKGQGDITLASSFEPIDSTAGFWDL